MKRSVKTVMAVACAAAIGAIGAGLVMRQPPTSPSARRLKVDDVPERLDTAAHVRPLAGDGHVGLRDGAASQALLAEPYGLAQDPYGALYISDAGDNNRIRVLRADGVVGALAGGAEGFRDGQGAVARFNAPSGIVLDELGNLYVADTGNHAIRKVTPDGAVTTLAGTGQPGFRDGPGTQAQIDGPMGLAIDKAGRVIVGRSRPTAR